LQRTGSTSRPLSLLTDTPRRKFAFERCSPAVISSAKFHPRGLRSSGDCADSRQLECASGVLVVPCSSIILNSRGPSSMLLSLYHLRLSIVLNWLSLAKRGSTASSPSGPLPPLSLSGAPPSSSQSVYLRRLPWQLVSSQGLVRRTSSVALLARALDPRVQA